MTPEKFFWERHAAIYAAAVSLGRQQVSVDRITIRAEMDKLGTKDAETEAEIDNLALCVPLRGNYTHYADLVIEQARWRERRAVALAQLEAIEKRNDEAWKVSTRVFAPERPYARTNGATTLHLVNDAGDVVGEQEEPCGGCQELEDQLSGVQKEVQGWRARYANLERDKDREARENALWLPAQALFEHWKKLTGHKNSKWGPGRFRDCESLLRVYGVEVFERAIAGIAYNPYSKIRRNGTTQRYDSWETLCKSAGGLEEYANRAPKGWRVTLKLSVETEREEQPQLAVAKGA